VSFSPVFFLAFDNVVEENALPSLSPSSFLLYVVMLFNAPCHTPSVRFLSSGRE